MNTWKCPVCAALFKMAIGLIPKWCPCCGWAGTFVQVQPDGTPIDAPGGS